MGGDDVISVEKLAAKVHAGGRGAQPALVSALRASGVPVLDKTGALMQPDLPALGIAVPARELQIASRLAGNGGGVRLPDLQKALAGGQLPPLGQARLAKSIAHGIRDDADGPDGPARTWARFVAALGRESGRGDLLSTATKYGEVELDGLQAQLVLRRMADVFAVEAKQLSGTLPNVSDKSSGAGVAVAVPAPAAANPGAPCMPSSPVWGKIYSGLHTGQHTAFGWAWKLLLGLSPEAGTGTGTDRLGTALMTASVVTDYAKLILTYMALTMDIHLDEGDRPLERTKKMRPAGERRRLHARLRYDTGKPEVANCLKLLTGFSGIDVSLPDSGPVAGAIFGFVGVQGFPGATAEQTKSALVQFYGGNPRMRLSDAKGETSIGVEGLGQRQKISEAASPVDKTASVRVEVVLKRANMWRDLKDAVDAASDLIPGPIDYVVTDGKPTPGGASFLKVPVELLMRTRWIAFRHQFTVRDWSTNWRLVGKITVKQQREYKYTFSEGYDNDVQDNRLDLDLNLTQSMGNLDSSLVLFDLEGRDSTEMTKWGGPAKFRQTYAASYEHVGKRYVFTRTEHGRNPVKPPAGTGIASVLWTGGDEVLLRLDLHTPYPVGTYKQLAKWPEKEERKEGKLGQPDWFKDPPSRLPILHGTVSTDGVTGEAVFDFDSSMYIAPGPRWNGGNDSSSETIEVSGSLRLVAAP